MARKPEIAQIPDPYRVPYVSVVEYVYDDDIPVTREQERRQGRVENRPNKRSEGVKRQRMSTPGFRKLVLAHKRRKEDSRKNGGTVENARKALEASWRVAGVRREPKAASTLKRKGFRPVSEILAEARGES